jgi:hypothetical protein
MMYKKIMTVAINYINSIITEMHGITKSPNLIHR